jgi:parvulin-like peptidyl-prolyl isomerase
MKFEQGYRITIGGALLASALCCMGQVVASHSPTLSAATVPANPAVVTKPAPASAGNAVAKVNGSVLTDRDLMREIQTIFPYAKLHNGVPKSMEPDVRKGALEMIIFEELVYQEALREKRTVPQERMQRAEAEFRKQFPTQQEYDQVLQIEVHGSKQVLREKIRRSLLIEEMLKTEIRDKANVSEVAARAYYNANPKNFEHPEMFSIQTISIVPPPNSNAEVTEEARKKADSAFKLAKATNTYQEFGLLAEKMSDDDWHVNMGDRKAVDRDKLPPPVVNAALAMKPGQVSELIQMGPAYTMFRLNAHIPAGRTPFQEVKAKIITDMEKSKSDQLRADMNKKLRKTAKIEVL